MLSKELLVCSFLRSVPSSSEKHTNTFFLSSPESELLEELSLRAGYTNQTADGQPKRLISVANLRNMKKGWDYTDVYFASGPVVCVTKLPDISRYEFVEGYEKPVELMHYIFPEINAYTSERMRDMLPPLKSKIMKWGLPVQWLS